MRLIILAILILVPSCSTKKNSAMYDASVTEFILDVEAGILRGPSLGRDEFMNVCKMQLDDMDRKMRRHICYVLFEEDLKAIKKYIIDLESMADEAR